MLRCISQSQSGNSHTTVLVAHLCCRITPIVFPSITITSECRGDIQQAYFGWICGRIEEAVALGKDAQYYGFFKEIEARERTSKKSMI